MKLLRNSSLIHFLPSLILITISIRFWISSIHSALKRIPPSCAGCIGDSSFVNLFTTIVVNRSFLPISNFRKMELSEQTVKVYFLHSSKHSHHPKGFLQLKLNQLFLFLILKNRSIHVIGNDSNQISALLKT